MTFFFLYLIYFVVPATQTCVAQCNRQPTSGGTVCWINYSPAGGDVVSVALNGGLDFCTTSSSSSSSSPVSSCNNGVVSKNRK